MVKNAAGWGRGSLAVNVLAPSMYLADGGCWTCLLVNMIAPEIERWDGMGCDQYWGKTTVSRREEGRNGGEMLVRRKFWKHLFLVRVYDVLIMAVAEGFPSFGTRRLTILPVPA